MDIEIKKLNPTDLGDFTDLIKIFEVVFEWENVTLPRSKHLQKLLDDSNFLVFVAKIEKCLVGGLTAHILLRYDTEKPSAYLYDLAVITDHQRKGIGKLLLKSLTDYCKMSGFSEVFVQAETDDIHAINFYKTTPISSELKATHFTYSFDA